MTLTASSVTLNAQSVLRPAPLPFFAPTCQLDGEPVPTCDFPRCGLCKRIRRLTGACNGQRTLAEAAAELGSDLDRCLSYGRQGLADGWLVTAQPPASAARPAPLPADEATAPPVPLEELRQGVKALFGKDRAKALWAEAGSMVTGERADDWLVALQLCARDTESVQLAHLADRLGL